MNADAFAPAIVACLIMVPVVMYGVKLAREENRTGVEPRAVTPFVFGCIGFMLLLWWIETEYQILFISHLVSIIIGTMVGAGIIYFGLHLVAALRRALNQSPE